MALEGSIKDFGLTDIFQLVNLQKKSGTLTVYQGDKSAIINFEKGQIVYATLTSKGESEKEKPGDDIKEALQVQIRDVIFQILRWKDGHYRFEPHIEYEGKYQISVPIDFILMEGIRMLDEWPYIEDIIPSKDIIFSQCYKWDETDTLFSSLSQDESSVFNLIDGKRDVKTIIDLTQLGEFEVYKILATLHVSGLISKTSTSKKTDVAIVSGESEKKRLWTAVQIAILTFIVSFILLLLPIREMAGINEIIMSSGRLKRTEAEKELSYLHSAIRYYYLINGVFPESLDLLKKERYLKRGFITDPWGGLFVYEPSKSFLPAKGDLKEIETPYRLYSMGPDRVQGTEDDIF